MYLKTMACCGLKELSGISLVHEDYETAFLEMLTEGRFSTGGNYDSRLDLSILKEFIPGQPSCVAGTTRGRLPTGWIIFTDAALAGNQPSYGESFRQFILKNKLGKVTVSEGGTNPNTTRTITVYLWKLDHDAIYKWLTTRVPDLPKAVETLKEKRAKECARANQIWEEQTITQARNIERLQEARKEVVQREAGSLNQTT